MAQWIIHGRFTFRGHAVVDADSEFEFDSPTAECCDWERRKVEGPH